MQTTTNDWMTVVIHPLGLTGAEVRPVRPMQPGQVLRRDCAYQRQGTANAFCGVEPKAGRHYIRVTPDRSSPHFADYLWEIATYYPKAIKSVFSLGSAWDDVGSPDAATCAAKLRLGSRE
jgi:hypothetical protein